ncbi:MAG: response regulator [Bacteroidota bacterium]
MNKKLGTILLIDDNEADNFFHHRTIQEADCCQEIKVFRDAEEALRFFKSAPESFKPDLIFLDIHMPGLNGWEFLEEYKQLPEAQKADTLLVMLSTFPDPEDWKKAEHDLHLSGYLKKPLDKENLTKILKEFFPQIF